MKTLIVRQSEVARLLPMRECIDAMADALKAVGRGEVVLPLRQVVPLPHKLGAVASMPAYSESPRGIGVKVIAVFPANRGTPYDSHQGVVLLFEGKHGQLQAIVDASEVTAIRTAAVSGLATQLLAREEAGDLAILGAGVQATTHLEAMLAVRKIRRVRVWSPTPENRDRFATRQGKRLGIPVESVASAQSAVADADLICTTTSAREPFLQGKWITPGAHINAVGSSIKTHRELHTDAVQRSRLFVDRRESALNEAGDFLLAKAEGAIDEDHIVGEIGDILLGKLDGRESAEEITLFKSLGIAIEDLAAVQMVFEHAQVQGLGTWMELGGGRHEGD
jgi:alanine dehydrogenase